MPGLIKDKMAMSQGDEANEQEPMEGPGPDGSMQHEAVEGEAPEANDTSGEANNNPQYVTALKFAMQALYDKGAAEGVAEGLRTARDPVEGLANTAYEITSIVDERTQGQVPDELFALLATRILQEVADIGEAAGLDYKPADVALALKQMILRYLGEQGMDTTQLQQAMDQVDPEEFNRMAMAGGEQEEVPA
jgi:hypothetical protein